MCYAATNDIWGQRRRRGGPGCSRSPCLVRLTNLRCCPARPGHRQGSERLSRRHFHACPLAPHRHGDSVGLRKRDGVDLLLPLLVHKRLVILQKSPFRTRGRGIYANSPACYRKRRRPRKADGWGQHLPRRAVKRGQRARGDTGPGDSGERGRRWPGHRTCGRPRPRQVAPFPARRRRSGPGGRGFVFRGSGFLSRGNGFVFRGSGCLSRENGLKSCGAAGGWGCAPAAPAGSWEARPGERKFSAEQKVSLSFKKHHRNIFQQSFPLGKLGRWGKSDFI
ncbi:uncharacterized protein LOC134561979 [Prinia subflava]|uniref:uncharacterized protein LOC134561979 n=1 Tax=Prinia subflava TaxID=208062 RepID=UPI002FE15246